MPAELCPAADGDQPHLLRLPTWPEVGDPVVEVEDALVLAADLSGPVILSAGRWPLRWGDYQRLLTLLETHSLALERVCSQEEGARVAAAALGLAVESARSPDGWIPAPARPLSAALSIHRGTLRSGDLRHGAGSLLVLGDVNPGAQISADGDVMVWGRLRGIAHAGRSGDRTARIVALHLQPLQIRIADEVARGPAEAPPRGLAEQAHLVNGRIQIDPADPSWSPPNVPAAHPGQPAVRRDQA